MAFLKNQISNIKYSIFFGVLSFVFGLVQFDIPSVEGGVSSINEIPMLVSVLYITNPLYMSIVACISAFITPPEGSVFSSFLMHFVGLFAFWYYYKYVIKVYVSNNVAVILFSIIGVVLYYVLLVLPIMAITNILILNNPLSFINLYFALLSSASYELITTSLILSIFLLQFNTSDKLKLHIISVEDQIKKRTVQLDLTIKQLSDVNEQLNKFNSELDDRVKNRTIELEKKNAQLSEYAFINSHLLRAPLARLIGLSNILMSEISHHVDGDTLERFNQSCNELDQIVKLLSEIISEKSILEDNNIDQLKEKIKLISKEISKELK